MEYKGIFIVETEGKALPSKKKEKREERNLDDYRECSPSKGEKLGKLLVSQPHQKLGFSVKTC